jgi:hypothetical protein
VKKKDSGQAVIEYVLVLSMVMGIMIYAVPQLKSLMNTAMTKYGGTVEQQLRTGSASPNLWLK